MATMRVYWLDESTYEFVHATRDCWVPARLLYTTSWQPYDVTEHTWLNNVSRCVVCGKFINWKADGDAQ